MTLLSLVYEKITNVTCELARYEFATHCNNMFEVMFDTNEPFLQIQIENRLSEVLWIGQKQCILKICREFTK